MNMSTSLSLSDAERALARRVAMLRMSKVTGATATHDEYADLDARLLFVLRPAAFAPTFVLHPMRRALRRALGEGDDGMMSMLTRHAPLWDALCMSRRARGDVGRLLDIDLGAVAAAHLSVLAWRPIPRLKLESFFAAHRETLAPADASRMIAQERCMEVVAYRLEEGMSSAMVHEEILQVLRVCAVASRFLGVLMLVATSAVRMPEQMALNKEMEEALFMPWSETLVALRPV